MRTSSLTRLLLASLGLLLILPSLALAQSTPRCAVAPFDGDVVLRRSFTRALEENGFVQVLPESDVDRAAEGGASPADIARATGANMVITGVVSGSRRTRRLELVAYDASGRQIATESFRVPNGGAGRRAIDEGISSLLSAALPALGSGGSSSTTSSSSSSSSSSTTAEPTRTETAVERPTRGTRETTPTPSPSLTGEYGANPLIFVVRLGVVMRTRDAETVLSSGMPRSWHAEPIYAELHAALELRPLAQSNDLGRGLFLRGEFASAVGLGTRDPSGSAVDTQFFRAAGDIGYLLPIGAAVEVGAAFGFGWDAYILGPNFEFPSVEIPHLRPALRGRLRLVDEYVVVGLESGLRIGLDRGGLTPAFGGGDTIGFDVGGSVSGALDFGLAYNVDVTWVGYWHGFSPGGPVRPSLGDGQNGTEQGVRFLLGLGYAFR